MFFTSHTQHRVGTKAGGAPFSACKSKGFQVGIEVGIEMGVVLSSSSKRCALDKKAWAPKMGKHTDITKKCVFYTTQHFGDIEDLRYH